jgi:hypothetical protein
MLVVIALLALTLLIALWVASRRSRELATVLSTLKGVEGELVVAGRRAELHERRATEFFNIIAGIEKERDSWQKFYFESAYQSGAAQAWLFRDLAGAVLRANSFAAELRKHGVKAKDVIVDPALKDVLADYGQAHPEGRAATVSRAPGFEEAKAADSALVGTPLSE